MAATSTTTRAGWLAAGPLASIAALLHGARDAATGGDDPPRPARIECVGQLEIVTRGARHADAADVRRLLRWRGRALHVARGDVDAVFVLGTGAAQAVPDVLVHARDDGEAGAFHLLWQQDGRLQTRRLCSTAGGPGTVRVLGPMAAPAPGAPRHRPLAGARWLMLDGRSVYDVAQRRLRAVPETPADLSVWHSVPPLGLSPDGCSLARFGSVQRGEARVPHVLVADLEAGAWAALPIDRTRMRYATHEMLDPAWLAHHWAWQRDEQGRDRLVERRHFRPLPWRGTWGLDGRSYRLEGAPAQAGVLCAAMLTRRFGGQAQPGPAGTGLLMRVQGERVQVLPDGFRILPAMSTLAERERQAALARRLGDAMDEELASGLHDAALSAWRVAA